MNNEYNKFLVDVLNILPDEIDCLIQAPSLDNSTIQNMMVDSEYEYYKLIHFDKERKAEFINQEVINSIGNYIQNVQFKKGLNLFFEGFDGVECGTLSKFIIVPIWFKEKYVSDICMISNEW